MRLARDVFRYAVMWVLVFAVSAGPLPLGIPRAEAAAPAITDTPGIKNFFTPKLFIIFDTSRSMGFRPGDLNGDTSVAAQDWDPNIPTLDTDCQNKWCIGKRALYQTLPNYTSRIEIGLSGYNQYFQLTTEPENFRTICSYDRIAYGNTSWGSWFFTRLDDLTGTGVDPAATRLLPASVEISYQSPASPTMQAPHRTRKWGFGTGNSGDLEYINVVGAGYAAGNTSNFAGYTYDWLRREDPGYRDDILASTLGGICPATIASYNAGSCTTQPCDLWLEFPFTQPYGDVYSRTDYGPSTTFGGVPYTKAGTRTIGFNDACTLNPAVPYFGTADDCDNAATHPDGCTLAKTGGPTKAYVGPVVTYFNSAVSPGPATQWELIATPTAERYIQLSGTSTCPALGTTVSASSGPAAWQSLATGGLGDGSGSFSCSGTAPNLTCTPSPTSCAGDPAHNCTWTMADDVVVLGETNQHFCRFTRTNYNWQQYADQCSYTASTYTYTTVFGDNYCRYKHYRDVFTHPIYTYSYIPNDGDIVGFTSQQWDGNDNLNGKPASYPYSGGQFANGFCPNLIKDSASNVNCMNGVLCKLSWRTNTTIGPDNYPQGRYSLSPYAGYPWTTVPAGFVTAADPMGTLLDPNFPPDPMAFAGNWLYGDGHPDLFTKNLVANLYDPSDSNPPSPPAYSCPTCTYQYSYKDPPTVDAAGFSAVAAAMPPQRDSGWARLHDGRQAISWTPLALDNALLGGGGPPTDGPILRMLSKYDPANNPAGFRMPDYGDYTPLTGSLRDAKEYLQTVMDADPYAGCGRSYYVMLLTDGEEQPAGLPGNDPVGAVKALRTMTTSGGLPVDVKTFVIGFGLFTPSPQLNAMAQAGGTSVNPSDLSTVDTSAGGVAFDGSTPDLLFRSLHAALGRILEGFFTRSKPAVNVAGTEMYVGYFRLLFNGLEWQGKLDSIDLDGKNLPSLADTVTDTDYAYLWRYGDDDTALTLSSSINKQLRRTVWTSLDPSSGSRIFFDYSGCVGCASASGFNPGNSVADQTALEARISGTPETAKRTIALLLNPGKNERFTFGLPKQSRASDIFHADPAIIEGAVQSSNWPDGTETAAYSGFQTAVKDRKKTVYIGANDGMLHAVEDAVVSPGAIVDAAIAGSERWGYVPRQLHPILSQMRDAHTFGVDGSVAVADVCGAGFSGSPCTAPDGWRTLLVGALGRGGRGLYALDITDPTNPTPKWEVDGSPPNVPRFGATWGAPVIGRTSVGGLGKVWSVFAGGGVLPGPDVQAHHFYVLDARTGALLDDGVQKAAFDVWDDPVDPAVNAVASRPTLYRPADKSMVERVFFNDTEGKIWRMKTGGTALASWAPGITAADVFFDPANASGSGACLLDVNGAVTPVLDATTGDPVFNGVTPVTLPLSRPRPKIFNRPMLALDPTGLVTVYVGTGDTDHPNDPLGTWDYFYAVTDTGTGCGRPLFTLRFAQNEKMLADPAFLDGVVYGTTYLPPASNLCTDAGAGFLYAWDARTGKPVAAIKNPLTGLMTSKVDLRAINPQLQGSGIPSAPIIRKGKLYLSVETDPAHPRQVDLGARPFDIKVKAWQRVK